MTSAVRWLQSAYARALSLYPRSFREDFAEEMQVVFNLSVMDAAGGGFWRLISLAMQEAISLPRALLASYIRERRGPVMQKQLNQWFVHEPGTWQEILLASLPFILLCLFPGVFSFSTIENSIPAVLGLALLGLLVFLLAFIGIIGLLVKLPRWSYPYAGVLIVGAGFFVLMLSGAIDFFFGKLSAPWWLRMVAFDVIYLCILAVTLTLVIWISQKFSLTRDFFIQVQKDWSLISFSLFGGILVLILGMYEDIADAGVYILSTAIPLFISIWLFLRSKGMNQRIISLALGLTVAMAIALIANIQLVDWVSPDVFQIGNLRLTRSLLSVIFSWILGEAMLFMPFLVSRIPYSKQLQSHTT